MPPRAAAQLALAAACVAAGGALAWQHPLAPSAVLAAFVAWSAAVAWRPRLWLCVVPAALPMLNFAPWTGWLAVEEFDLLLLGVAAGGWAHAAFRGRGLRGTEAAGSRSRMSTPMSTRAPNPLSLPTPLPRAFVGAAWLFALASVVALGRGISAAGAIGTDAFPSPASALDAWRGFKSVAWVALLWPLLRHEMRIDAAGAARRFASGMLAGLAVVSLAIVWERAAYPGLWDFASRYRTTALFWEMHVGGAAIDAYLAIAVPFVVWALASARSRWRWCAAALLALLTGYACLTTFSRGVYAAVLLSLALLGALHLLRRADGRARARALHALAIGAALLLVALALGFAFDAGGWAGIALALLASAALWAVFWLALGRWLEPMRPLRRRRVAALALVLALLLEAVAVLGLGTFMRERLAATDRAAGGRLAHWQRGIGLLRTPADWLGGIGTGRVPAAYAAYGGEEFPGTLQWSPSQAGSTTGAVSVLPVAPVVPAVPVTPAASAVPPVPAAPAVPAVPDAAATATATAMAAVRLSGPKTRPDLQGLLALTQRVPLRSGRSHQSEFEVRALAPAVVNVSVCELHLLYPRDCQQVFFRVEPSAGAGAGWRRVSLRLRGGPLSVGEPLLPRGAVFSLSVLNVGGVAEFRKLALTAPDGAALLANGDFARGRAQWLPSARGYFVPWHVDNLYLELLIERGVPGLLAFIVCAGLALWRLLGAAGRGAREEAAVPFDAMAPASASFAPFLAASLCGVLCVGLVSSVMDVPRVAFLMLLFAVFAVELIAVAAPARRAALNGPASPAAPAA
jgi:hypothetical protein